MEKTLTRPERVTMQMIADSLSVTKSLVSLALNDKYGVSEVMRGRIFSRALEMGYPIARRVPVRCGAMLLPARESVLAAGVAAGAARVLTSAGLDSMVMTWPCSDSARTEEYLLRLRASGVIAVEPAGQELLNRMAALDIPLVAVGSEADGADCVRLSLRAAGRLCGKALAGQGLVLAYANRPDEEFLTGLRETHPALPGESNKLRRFCERGQPFSVAVQEKGCAKAVYDILSEFALVPGRDVSVVAAGDCPAFARMDPPLTSVHLFEEEGGEYAARLLLKRLEHRSRLPVSLEIAPRLVSRDSVIKLPSA